MRHQIILTALAGALVLSACGETGGSDVERAMEAVNAIDDTDLSSIMLTSADPADAVSYF